MSFLDSIKSFAKDSLRAVETRVTTADGREVIERRINSDATDILEINNRQVPGYVVDLKPDLEVGQVLPFLSFGSQDVAHDVSVLRAHRVTHILTVATAGITITDALVDVDAAEFVHKHVDLLDLAEVDVRQVFDKCFVYIDHCRDQTSTGDRRHVFVHCNAGISRSATVVIAYLMSRYKMRFDDALEYVRTKRPAARPNDGFMKQLRAYDMELHDNQSGHAET